MGSQIDAVGTRLARFRRVQLALLAAVQFCLFPLTMSGLRRKLGLNGESVLVVGSAPSASLEGLRPFTRVIGVHGSPELVARRFGLSCDVVVVDQSLFNVEHASQAPGKRPIVERSLLLKNPTQVLVIAASNNIPPTRAVETLVSSRTKLHLSKIQRRLVVSTSTLNLLIDRSDSSTMASTGALAICLAVLSGARDVQFTGFNLRSGIDRAKGGTVPLHFYQDEGLEPAHHVEDEAISHADSLPRNHSAADAVVISSLSMRFKHLHSNESEFETLLYNWSLRPRGLE